MKDGDRTTQSSVCERCQDLLENLKDVDSAVELLGAGILDPVAQRFVATGCFTVMGGAIDELAGFNDSQVLHDEGCRFRARPLIPDKDPRCDALRWSRHAYAHHVPVFDKTMKRSLPLQPSETRTIKAEDAATMWEVMARLGGKSETAISEYGRAARADLPVKVSMRGKAGAVTTVATLQFAPWLSRLERWRKLGEERQNAVRAVLDPLMDRPVGEAIRYFREVTAGFLTPRTPEQV